LKYEGAFTLAGIKDGRDNEIGKDIEQMREVSLRHERKDTSKINYDRMK